MPRLLSVSFRRWPSLGPKLRAVRLRIGPGFARWLVLSVPWLVLSVLGRLDVDRFALCWRRRWWRQGRGGRLLAVHDVHQRLDRFGERRQGLAQRSHEADEVGRCEQVHGAVVIGDLRAHDGGPAGAVGLLSAWPAFQPNQRVLV